ncbi:hypothetical protein J1N35_014247, partial [Gossypium stocksii]
MEALTFGKAKLMRTMDLRIDEDKINWHNGGMDGLLWHSREFGDIMERISTSLLGRHYGDDYPLVLH